LKTRRGPEAEHIGEDIPVEEYCDNEDCPSNTGDTGKYLGVF